MPLRSFTPSARVCSAALLAISFLASSTNAQCNARWLPSDSDYQLVNDGGSGVGASILWDPDGSGPETPKLVLGGTITRLFGVSVQNIAMLDLENWRVSDLGGGTSGRVYALAVDADGRLLVGGAFTSAGGTPANRIARWNGSAWSPVGNGFTGDVRALAALPGGEIIAGGAFSGSGAQPLSRIARWDGGTWQPLGDGFDAVVRSISVSPGGTMYAVGDFSKSGTTPMIRIASWNGSAWAALGSGLSGGSNPIVSAVRVHSDGRVLAAGKFTSAGETAVANIASWDGAGWQALGAGVPAAVSSLLEMADGSIVATGYFQPPNQTIPPIIAVPALIWDGSAWQQTAEFDARGVTTSLELEDGSLFLAGGALGKWNGTNMAALSAGPSFGSPVHTWGAAFTTDLDGNLIAGGFFSSAAGERVNNIARWDGVEWTGLGEGVTGSPNTNPACIYTLATLPNGNIIAGGEFIQAGNAPAPNIARWDGTQWHPIGDGFNQAVRALAVLSNGDLIAGGSFSKSGSMDVARVARWDGVQWSPLGPGFSGTVLALALLPNGDLVAANGYRVFVWNGTLWSQLGPDFSGGTVSALAVLPSGDIFAGGTFTSAGGNPAARIARWNGTEWLPLGSGITGLSNSSVNDLLPMPDNSVIAAGYFSQAGGVSAHGVARWNGSQWSGLSNGNSNIKAVATNAAGEVIAGSWYENAIIRWTSDNRPWIARHPVGQSASLGATVTFSAFPATGYAGLTSSWEIETSSGSGIYEPLAEGPMPGAESAVVSVTPLDPSHRPGASVLTISNVSLSLSGRHVRASISNSCDSATSNPALLSIAGACPADLNSDTVVDDSDFVLFLVGYNILDCADPSMPSDCPADLDGDSLVGDQDFIVFIAAYNELSCP